MAHLTKEKLAEILETKPTSLGAVARELGYKGKISGSLSEKIRELAPNIDEVLEANRTAKAQAEVEGKKDAGGEKKAKKRDEKAPKKSKFPRDPKNPFREGSS